MTNQFRVWTDISLQEEKAQLEKRLKYQFRKLEDRVAVEINLNSIRGELARRAQNEPPSQY